eukprot:GHVN01059157.1.p1 GENE.GHVN01059157.1~~GHVN01059157.1.p1  ORF type:complete len:562 (+),score=61.96 GHVN01059157.1:37-1722(+)
MIVLFKLTCALYLASVGVALPADSGKNETEAKRRRPNARGSREPEETTNLTPEWTEANEGEDESTTSTTTSKPTTTTTKKPKPKTKIDRKRVAISAIDYLMEDPELTTLADQLRATGLADEAFFKKVAITVFAPTDDVFASLPMDMNALDFPGKMDILGKIIDYHTLAPKLLRPAQIALGKPYIGKTRLKQKLEILREGEHDTDIIINGYANVLEIVEAKKGVIYKVDSLLYPKWGEGPNLVEFIRSTPWLSKTKWLLEQSGLADQFALAGPVTSFLVPDDGWVTPNGVAIPDCFFHALARPEHEGALKKMLSWITLPGVYNRTIIEGLDALVNAEPPHLAVAHVKDPQHGHDIYTFIEGKQVKEWDIPVFNGVVHVLAELPFRPDIDLSMALWDCTHDLCFECPKLAGHILQFFDNGLMLPGDEPEERVIPPGPRPPWVCQGTEKWFPPGWNDKKWFDYVDAAKKQSKNAEKLARKGYTEAAYNLARLDEKLEIARIEEAQREAKQDWLAPDSAVKHGKDPSMSVMGRLNRMQRPFPDCKHKDNPLKLTTNDLRYITRWQ